MTEGRSELEEKSLRYLDAVDKRKVKQVRAILKMHRTTVRIEEKRWEVMLQNAAYFGMTVNAYVNMAVENQNAKYRRQQRDYLKSREEAP